jgi:hypothetical protein
MKKKAKTFQAFKALVSDYRSPIPPRRFSPAAVPSAAICHIPKKN